METSLVNTEKSVATMQPPSDSTLISYLDSLGMTKKLTQGEKAQYLEICKAFQLNPFKREIHVSKYGDNFSVITGYEVYIKRAERSGLLRGWKVETTGKVSDNSLKAKITIYREGWDFPFEHEVYYEEYVQRTRDGVPNRFWREKPVTMIKKVAMAQGFRLCFSDELGGMPYTADETGWEPVTPAMNIDPKTEGKANGNKSNSGGDRKTAGNGKDEKKTANDVGATDTETGSASSTSDSGGSGGNGEKVITAPQRRKLFATLKNAGGDEDDLRSIIAEYGYESTKDIKRKDFDLILQKLIPVNIDDF